MIRISALCFLIPCSAVVLSGCFSAREIRTYGELSAAYRHPLRIVTVDTTVYDLDRFSFNDSLLSGIGECLIGGRWLHFSGDLPMSRIAVIETRTLSPFQTIIGLGLAGLTAEAIIQSTPGRGLSTYRAMGGDGIW